MADFTQVPYEDDAGRIHKMRVAAPLAEAISSYLVDGAINDRIPAKISKHSRQFGLGPRGVHTVNITGTAPNTRRHYKFIPCPKKAAFGVTPFIDEGVITVDTVEWTVISLRNEDYS